MRRANLLVCAFFVLEEEEKRMDRSEKLGKMPMGRLMADMSIPMMVSLLVQSLYNIVDSIFVARLSEKALTATSLAFPAQMLMIAVGVGMSVGLNAALSKAIGARDREAISLTTGTGFLLSVVCSLAFAVIGLLFARPFAAVFTEDTEIARMSGDYLWICMVLCFGQIVGMMLQRFLQAAGDTFGSMISLIAGAVTNIILDPIMIFGLLGCPAMGIRGAAIATVIGQWVNLAVAAVLNRTRNPVVTMDLKTWHLDGKCLGAILRVGLPTTVMQAIGSLMVTCVNAVLMPFSATAVAFFGIYYKLQNFLFMPMNGLGQAAIPIAGFNYGSGNKARVREMFGVMLPVGIAIAVIATLIFEVIPAPLLSLFSASDEMLTIGVPALRIIAPTFAFASVTAMLGYALSGLGVGMVNMVGAALRQLIVFVPVMVLLVRIGGIAAAWWAVIPAELIACAYACFMTVHVLKKKEIL